MFLWGGKLKFRLLEQKLSHGIEHNQISLMKLVYEIICCQRTKIFSYSYMCVYAYNVYIYIYIYAYVYTHTHIYKDI